MPRRRLAALLLGTTVAGGLLGAGEVKCLYDERLLRYMWDSGRRFATRPGVAGANASSFHERDLPRVPAPEKRRIVVIGDSVSWGTGPAEEAYPRLVEHTLGSPWQVLNLARFGYDTQQCGAVLREYGWDYKPELVVYASYTNDPIPSRVIEVNGGAVWVGAGGLLPPFVRHRSALLRRVEGTLLRPTLNDRPEWAFYRAALTDIRDQALAHGVPLLVLGLVPHILAEPDLALCSARLGLPGHCEDHLAIAAEQEAIALGLDLPFLSALPALRASGRTDFYPASDHHDWQHPGPQGHVVFAQSLRALLAPYTAAAVDTPQ